MEATPRLLKLAYKEGFLAKASEYGFAKADIPQLLAMEKQANPLLWALLATGGVATSPMWLKHVDPKAAVAMGMGFRDPAGTAQAGLAAAQFLPQAAVLTGAGVGGLAALVQSSHEAASKKIDREETKLNRLLGAAVRSRQVRQDRQARMQRLRDQFKQQNSGVSLSDMAV